MPTRRYGAAQCLALLAALLAAALAVVDSGRAQPPAPAASEPATPVVYVPGITGSKLRDRETGEIVWGEGRQLVFPRDGGYALARPIHRDPTSADSRLEATTAIEAMRLFFVHQEVYSLMAEALEGRGYRLGDLRSPGSLDTAFFFAYDWRLDNVVSARELGRRLQELRRVRGEDRLAVDLVCQSNGAHICRYLVKYGGASLAEAEAGRSQPPATLEVRKLILLGSSTGGGLRILRELHRGRTYLMMGRKWRPEVLFTFPSVYQDLPVFRRDLFLDADGNVLPVELFDAESWRRYGWSVFDSRTRKRLERRRRADLFGDEARRMEFLRRMLDRARRFHELLGRDVEGFGATRYYSVQSRSEETPDRAVLIRAGGRWETLFTGDEKLRRRGGLHRLATAPGDGHATVTSQLWLSLQERAALAAETAYVGDGHFQLTLRPETHRRLLEFLADEPPASPHPGPFPQGGEGSEAPHGP